MPNVIKIPKKPKKGNSITKTEVQKLRVAAYCRVSTDTDEQATSYETQISHYTEYICSNPEWELAGVFADDGISATSTARREEFNHMIDECRNGKIDMIITKSISRFARNTVDCLNYIRDLKQMNIPVFFEKESINTMDAKGEVLLTIMASLAQQESESLSQNVKLGMQYRFQQGKVMVNTKCFLGYDKDEDGNLVINPEEAEIVKRIFREYLEGSGCGKICRGLERDGIKSARGNIKWHDSTVRKMLENEKYMGDALLQKTYTLDFLTKRRIKNTGEMPQYYVEDNHEPIISRETFMLVQEEIARRGYNKDGKDIRKRHSSKYCFTGLTYCGECSGSYQITRWNVHGKKKDVWRCKTRKNNFRDCSSRTVYNSKLQDAFVTALNIMLGDSSEYVEILTANLEQAISDSETDVVQQIDSKLDELQSELTERMERRKNYDEISEEIFRLRDQREKVIMDSCNRENFKRRITELKQFIASTSEITEFDENLVRQMVEKVTIFHDRILFEFRSGVEINVEE